MMAKKLDTLILSITPQCNFNCTYCHNEIYYSSASISDEMPLSLCEKATIDYVNYLKFNSIEKGVICLTGGEPLSVGYEYIKKFIRTVRDSEKKSGIAIKILLQTNGYLINDDWCKIISENDIGVGLSIDGHPELTNTNRVCRNPGVIVSEVLIESAETLNKHGIDFGVLMVVTSNSCGVESEILNYIQSISPDSIAFTPCLDKGPQISPIQYSEFISNFFDAWISSGNLYPEIRMFQYCRQRLLNCLQMPIPCEFGNDCPNTICVSCDGKVWVCDVYMGDSKGYIGDILKNGFIEIVHSKEFQDFQKKNSIIPDECKSCEALKICNGGCSYRKVNGKDYFCDATIKAYSKTKEYIDKQMSSISLKIIDCIDATAEQQH